MQRRRTAWLPLALCSVLLLTACGKVPVRQANPTTPGAGVSPGETVTIRVFGSGGPAVDAAIAAFQTKHPHYRVEKVPYSPGEGRPLDVLRRRIAEGAVDVVPVQDPVGLVNENLVLPLDPLIQKTGFDTKRLGPVLDQFRLDGTLYEMPYNLSPVVILYNKALFQQAGVPEPQAGWTWDQFREAALKLTRGAGETKQWGFAPNLGDDNLVRGWLAARTRNGNLLEVDERSLAEGLAFFNTLTFSDQSMPPAPAQGSRPSTRVYFEEGKAAMGLMPISTVGFLSKLIEFPWGVAPFPTSPGQAPHAMAYPNSYAIAATTKQPDAAFQFISFLAEPEGAAAMARAGGFPLLRSDEVKEAWFEQQPAPPPGTQFAFAINLSVAPRVTGTDTPPGKRMAALNRLLGQTLSGSQAVDQALEEYRREIGRIEKER